MELLLTGAFNYSDEQYKMFEDLGYRITFVQDERVELSINVEQFDAVVCNGLFMNNDINKFKSLKLIQLTSAGLDRVPVELINKKAISLYNAKGVYSAPMAEWAVLKVLEIYKNSSTFYNYQQNKQWKKVREIYELTDKCVGIIGTGDIGTQCAKRFSAFDVNLIGIDIVKNQSGFFNEQYHIKNIKDVIGKCDVVILTLPLTPSTKHMFNSELLSSFKDNSVLINISRGAVINENDLIFAIDSNKFLGVALDVFEQEPLKIDSLLWNMDKVILTPHNSFLSDKINERLFKLIYNNLRSFNETSAN